jgi:hypothetical protein
MSLSDDYADRTGSLMSGAIGVLSLAAADLRQLSERMAAGKASAGEIGMVASILAVQCHSVESLLDVVRDSRDSFARARARAPVGSGAEPARTAPRRQPKETGGFGL